MRHDLPPAPAEGVQTVDGLDFLALLQASRAISSELVLERLLEILMRTMLTSAGANRGRLLVARAGSLLVAAAGEVQAGELLVRTQPPRPAEPDELPSSIVDFVRRTRERVLLGSTAQPHPFSSDAYIAASRAQSILCLPIVFKAELSGVLYLENSLVSDAFSGQRLAALELLTAQAAVSLENARLFTLREQAEERFSKAFHSNPNPMSITRVGDGAFVDINEASLRMLGYTRSEVIGRNVVELGMIDAVQREKARQALIDAKSTRNVELDVRTKSGGARVVHASQEIIELAGEMCILTCSNDVTERKSAEEQLRQAQKLEALGRLAGGIAHDFNNLLTVIHGYGWMAVETLETAHEAYPLLCEILKAGERATNLTQQLLAYSRKQVLEPKWWDLNVIVADIAPMLKRLIGEDVVLAVEPGEELGLARVDRGQIEQIILNLAVNARDAMPQGGKLTLRTQRVVLDASHVATHLESSSGPHLLLSISDNGTGMTPAVAERIFEPFFTTKEAGKGTGLGLSVVYGIVKQSGGGISLRTAPHEGSTFCLYFPEASREIADAEELPTTLRSAAYAGHETILLVEDEEQVRTFAARALEALGYVVLEAANGSEAFEFFQRSATPVQLLITDVIMPELGGPALVKRLRSQGKQIPVLYISGYAEQALGPDGVPTARGAFLQKPFSPFDLGKKVREVLNESAR